MRTINENELHAVSGGESDGGTADPNCRDAPMTCYMRDIRHATAEIAGIIENVWKGIFTLVDVIACHMVPLEVSEWMTEWFNIHNPCKKDL